MSGNGKGKKDQGFFFLKSLLSRSRAGAVIRPDLVASIKSAVGKKKDRPLEKKNF